MRATPREIQYVTADSALRMILIALLVGMLLGAAVGIGGVLLGVTSSLEESK